MGYRLNAEALRIVNKDEKGQVTYRRRYKKGAVIDTAPIEQSRVEHFVARGIFVSDEDAPEPETAPELTPEPETAPEPTPEPEPQDDPSGDAGDGPEPGDEPEADEYDEMSYPELQQAAKARDLNAGGSADDLRARLRADDAADSE